MRADTTAACSEQFWTTSLTLQGGDRICKALRACPVMAAAGWRQPGAASGYAIRQFQTTHRTSTLLGVASRRRDVNLVPELFASTPPSVISFFLMCLHSWKLFFFGSMDAPLSDPLLAPMPQQLRQGALYVRSVRVSVDACSRPLFTLKI